jgi:hypothetical protein
VAWCAVQPLAGSVQEVDTAQPAPEDARSGIEGSQCKENVAVMTTEETEIYEFLKRFPNQFVTVNDISKSVGPRKNFHEDRNWALPILRRMELEALLESNPYGEYRLKQPYDDSTSFKKALETPGIPLGDTTIISLEARNDQANAA